MSKIKESTVANVKGVDQTALRALLKEMGHEVVAPAPEGVYVRVGMTVKLGNTSYTVAPRDIKDGYYGKGNYSFGNVINLYTESGVVTWNTADGLYHKGKRVINYEECK